MYSEEEKKLQHIKNIFTSLPIFKKAALTLYYNVPFRDLRYRGEFCDRSSKLKSDFLQDVQKGLELELLICSGDRAVMAARLHREVWNYGSGPGMGYPGLPVLSFADADPADEDLADEDAKRSCAEAYLERLLEEKGKTEFSYRAYKIDTRLQRTLKEKYLLWEHTLYKSQNREGTSIPVRMPSSYGKDSGIVEGYYTDREGRICRGLFGTERAWGVIRENLDCSRKKAEEQDRIVPFSERMRRLKAALPSDRKYSIFLVKRFADLPIDSYLSDYPEDLAELKGNLKKLYGLEGEITYQQTAVCVYRMLNDRKTRDMGESALDLLSMPLYIEYRRRNPKECLKVQ